MLLFVLGASIGLPLHTRKCRMPEMPVKTSIFLADVEDCCQKTTNTACKISKEKPLNPCCEFIDNFLQIDFDNVENIVGFDFSNFYFECTLSHFEFIFDNKYTFLFQKIIFFTDSSPPPLKAKDFLRHQKHWNC